MRRRKEHSTEQDKRLTAEQWQLVLDNSGLAYRVALQVYNRKGRSTSCSLDDLMQEAYLAIAAAVKGFDPTRGFKFSTYATQAVRNQLCRFLHRQSLMPLPEYLWTLMRMHEGHDPRTGLKPHSVSIIGVIPYYGPKGVEIDPPKLDGPDYLVDGESYSSLCAKLCRALNQLDEDSKQLICQRYALDGNKIRTRKEIAADMGVSHEAVRKQERRVLHKLRALIMENG